MSVLGGSLYVMGLAIVIAASYCGQKIDGDIISGPASRKMFLFLHYGSGLTALLGFVYFIIGFFVFGWQALLLFLGALIAQCIPLVIAFRFESYLPLLCVSYIILGNVLCVFALFYGP